MVEDDTLPDHLKQRYPEFDLIPDISPELGGSILHVSDAMLDKDAPNDLILRHKLENNIVPSVDTIAR